MSLSRRIGPLLAASVTLAACAGGLSAPVTPPATPAAGASAAVSSRLLSETGDARIIQESYPGTARAWVGLPYKTLYLPKGQVTQLKARLLVRDAADVPALTWTSSDPTVVSVTKGLLTGLKVGTAIITAEAGGERATLSLQVVTSLDKGVIAGSVAGGTGGDSGSGAAGTPIAAVETLPGELVYGRMGAYAINAGGFQLHVLGGSDGVKPLNTIEWAPYLNEAGSGKQLGQFILNTDGFIDRLRVGLAAVFSGREIFLVGGEESGSVERTRTDTPKGVFQTVPSTLDTPRRYFSKIASSTWVLLVGGESMDGAPLASVEYATLNTEATGDAVALGDFSTVTGASLIQARTGCGSVVAGNFLYTFGGGDGDGNPLASVERAPLQAAGVGAFEAVATTRLLTPRRYFSTIQAGQYVYVIGGQGADDEALDSIERATIGEDGSLSAFEEVGFLAVARYKAAAALLDGEFAIAGGMTDAGVTRDVEVRQLQSFAPGAVRPASPSPSATPTVAPTATPTVAPTASPTPEPTATP